MTTVTLRLQ